MLSYKEEAGVDFQFSIGEGLSCVAAGQYCDLYCNPWNYTPPPPITHPIINDDIFDKTLSFVIDKYGYKSSPRIRQVIIIIIIMYYPFLIV